MNDDDHEGVLEQGGVRVDLARQEATVQQRLVPLTPTELRLLAALLRRPGVALTRAELCAALLDRTAQERTVDAHIKALRRKLGAADLIQTVHRVGYRFAAVDTPDA
jgi:DNA-binding response OmpR family regulator